MKKRNNRNLYVPESGQIPESDGIIRLLAPSFIGIIVCAVCLVGLTMAWFSSNVEIQTNRIDTSVFVPAQIMVKDMATRTSVAPSGGKYVLKKGKKYDIVLNGNAELGKASGYGIITLRKTDDSEETKLYTVPIKYDGTSKYLSVDFYLQASDDCNMEISFGWGDNPNSATVESNRTYTFPTGVPAMILHAQQESMNGQQPDSVKPEDSTNHGSPSTYTVKSGDTLAGIAKEVGSTAEKLAAYNNIKDEDDIKAGTTLKIPPKDYEIPKPEDTSSKAPTSSEGTSSTSSTSSTASTQPEPTSSAEGSSSDVSSGTSSAN